jgi:hypothetical protein
MSCNRIRSLEICAGTIRVLYLASGAEGQLAFTSGYVTPAKAGQYLNSFECNVSRTLASLSKY